MISFATTAHASLRPRAMAPARSLSDPGIGALPGGGDGGFDTGGAGGAVVAHAGGELLLEAGANVGGKMTVDVAGGNGQLNQSP